MSARPQRFLHADSAGSLLSTRPMSFYALQERFWQLHDEATFSPAESHLYFYLLRLFNSARWPAKIYRKRNALAAEVNLDFKTLDKARARLESRGLLTYVAGNKVQSATWSLADCSQMAGNISLPTENSSQMQGNNSSAKGNNQPDCSQMEGKISPPYKEEEKTVGKEEEKTPPTLAADAAGGGAPKKIGESLPAESSHAQASHTRGAADVGTRKASRAKPVRVPPELLPTDCPLADLLNPPGDAHRVQELAEPLTLAQAERLLADYPEPAVRDILCQMANWQPLLQKATSANLTARNWLGKRAKEQPSSSHQPHATANRPYPPRPVNGHKPDGDSAALARAIAELH